MQRTVWSAFKLSSGGDEAIGLEFLQLSQSDADEPWCLVSYEKYTLALPSMQMPRTHTLGTAVYSCRCAHAETHSNIYRYAARNAQWDHLCSITAILSSPCFFFVLSSLSPFIHSPFSYFCFPLLFPLSSHLFYRPPSRHLFLLAQFPFLSPFLPLEAGDVEWCSAVSDYQALLCERNDNHCAALQRQKGKRE